MRWGWGWGGITRSAELHCGQTGESVGRDARADCASVRAGGRKNSVERASSGAIRQKVINTCQCGAPLASLNSVSGQLKYDTPPAEKARLVKMKRQRKCADTFDEHVGGYN